MLNLKNLPQSPGVYLFKNKFKEIIYIGKAINLKNRVKSYFLKNFSLGPKTRTLIENINSVETIKVDSEIEALLLEANLIQKYRPKYNINLKDNSSYPLIKITVKEKYPRISQTRKIESDSARYFGPYPDTETLRFILKTLRKIFQFRSCKTLPKSPCLFYYIKKCQGPCIFKNIQQKKEYQKNIKNIILFLEGKKQLLIKKLEKQMKTYSQKEDFEKANEIKNQINKIKIFTKPVNKPQDYLQNPNLYEDQITNSLNELSNILNIKTLTRIECYDVANIQSQYSTASMTVFVNGQKDSSQYRRFKIKTVNKPNDYEMLKEVFSRRFKHKEWPKPNLVLIDGGLGQLNAFNKLKLNIPAVALAKRFNHLYYKDKKITLKKSSNALKILERIRDEAHRFATSYHKKLREKALTETLT